MSRARDLANFGDGIDTSSITSGTFADARIAVSNVTQHEGSIDALASNPTVSLGNNATFPAGMVLQTLREIYSSQTEASSEVKTHELTLTTKKANSKLAYWVCAALGGAGDGDNIYIKMTLETGSTANTPSSSNYLPTGNRAPGTDSQNNGIQFHVDVMPFLTSHSEYLMHHYGVNDVVSTSYAKDTQITMGCFISGSCHINKNENRSNIESGITTLIVQEIAT